MYNKDKNWVVFVNNETMEKFESIDLLYEKDDKVYVKEFYCEVIACGSIEDDKAFVLDRDKIGGIE